MKMNTCFKIFARKLNEINESAIKLISKLISKLGLESNDDSTYL